MGKELYKVFYVFLKGSGSETSCRPLDNSVSFLNLHISAGLSEDLLLSSQCIVG